LFIFVTGTKIAELSK